MNYYDALSILKSYKPSREYYTNKSIERVSVSAVVLMTFVVIIVQSLTAVLYHVVGKSEPVPVLSLALISALITLLSAPVWKMSESPKWAGLITAGFSIAGAVVLLMLTPNSLVAVGGLLIVCPLASYGGWYLMRRLPAWMDGGMSRSPLKSALWILLTVLALFQLGRLNCWIINSDNDGRLGTWDPLSEDHMCMTSYVYAADLNRQGVINVYDPMHYPGLNPNVVTRQTVDGLLPEDPYQYPPQFLIVPHLALMFTNSFEMIKVVWFVIQVSAFFLLAVWLARSIGGDRGKTAIWLIAAVMASFQMFSNFQYGQFHLFSIMLGITGLLLFDQKRYALGGAALGFAILSKISPGILLVWLVAQRKWKEVGWTVAACGAYTIIALFLVGANPFVAFFTDHIQNLLSGTAFAFGDIRPELREIILVFNQSPYATILKLQELGIPGMSATLGNLFQNAYILAVVGLAVLGGFKWRPSRHPALVGLALLNLAGLFSKGAWGDYVAVGSVWLLTFVTAELVHSFQGRVAYFLCWLFIALSFGIFPIEGVALFPTAAILTMIGFGMMIALNGWFILRKPVRI